MTLSWCHLVRVQVQGGLWSLFCFAFSTLLSNNEQSQHWLPPGVWRWHESRRRAQRPLIVRKRAAPDQLGLKPCGVGKQRARGLIDGRTPNNLSSQSSPPTDGAGGNKCFFCPCVYVYLLHVRMPHVHCLRGFSLRLSPALQYTTYSECLWGC